LTENTPIELLAFSAMLLARVDGSAAREHVDIRLLVPEVLFKLPATAEIDRKRTNRYALGIVQMATLELMTRTLYIDTIPLVSLLGHILAAVFIMALSLINKLGGR
jgi:hypothetical protein